ncbi:MAG: class IV adenylate cyclase [Anaerolineales bacterium]
MTFEEIEVKFYVRSLPPIAERLEGLGAVLRRERAHEVNLRFDLADGSLSRADRVLRLRTTTGEPPRLTYKGPGATRRGVRARQEIELSLSEASAARALLEALGFQVVVLYEKYRAIYALNGREIMLDELPFGAFVEIEGEDAASIRRAAEDLGLAWDRRIPASYLHLFEKVRRKRRLTCRDLTFANFEGLSIIATDLGVLPAD